MKPTNKISNKVMQREQLIRKNIIEWLDSNLKRTDSTKTALAKACGVTKQSVSSWFVDGRMRPANIKAAAEFFQVEAPLDLLDDKPNKAIADPLDFTWSPYARQIVSMVMKDNGKGSTVQRKLRLIADVYEYINSFDDKEKTDDIYMRSYISELQDATRIKHIELLDKGDDSKIIKLGKYISLRLSDFCQVIILPDSPNENHDIVRNVIIDLAQLTNKEDVIHFMVGNIGEDNKRLIDRLFLVTEMSEL